MSKNRYYYYDHDSCAFVEVETNRRKVYVRSLGLGVAVLLLAGLVAWSVDELMASPEELALRAENEALQDQLTQIDDRLEVFNKRLDQLSDRDRNLYRTLLEAEPISDKVRQVGVGGSDAYERFNRFGATAAMLLRKSSQELDRLERQMNLQNTSYRELRVMAAEREQWLAQMPAILPADGRVVSGYGVRRHPILRVQKMHAGVDVLVPSGSAVVATGDGVVREAGWGSGYGNHIRVEHPVTGYTTVYAHLSEIGSGIRAGREVKRGEQIGLSGNTGRSTAPHLHYEVRDENGSPLNPVYFFMPSMTPHQYREMLAESDLGAVSLD
jgi:murein DD-endopeptidase MepM/ murein hydrolase activator NlpD